MNKTDRALKDRATVRHILLRVLEGDRPTDIAAHLRTSSALVRRVACSFGRFEVHLRPRRERYVIYAHAMQRAGITEVDCVLQCCSLIEGVPGAQMPYGWLAK